MYLYELYFYGRKNVGGWNMLLIGFGKCSRLRKNGELEGRRFPGACFVGVVLSGLIGGSNIDIGGTNAFGLNLLIPIVMHLVLLSSV